MEGTELFQIVKQIVKPHKHVLAVFRRYLDDGILKWTRGNVVGTH